MRIYRSSNADLYLSNVETISRDKNDTNSDQMLNKVFSLSGDAKVSISTEGATITIKANETTIQ